MKRKPLSDEGAVAVSSAAVASLAKVKAYHRYNVFAEMTVVWLRTRLRRRRCRKWYCLKKSALVTTCVLDESVRIITRLLRDCARFKRDQLIAERVAEGCENKCPICLTSLQEFERSDLFVHDGIVFCKNDVVACLSSEYNFSNPITRKSMGLHAVRRLGSVSLLQKFAVRGALRKRAIDLSSHFFFLENDIVSTFKELLAVVDYSGSDFCRQRIFQDAYLGFDQQVQHMFAIDPKRSICVLKSLRTVIRDWNASKPVTKAWSSDLIRRIIEVYSVHEV